MKLYSIFISFSITLCYYYQPTLAVETDVYLSLSKIKAVGKKKHKKLCVGEVDLLKQIEAKSREVRSLLNAFTKLDLKSSVEIMVEEDVYELSSFEIKRECLYIKFFDKEGIAREFRIKLYNHPIFLNHNIELSAKTNLHFYDDEIFAIYKEQSTNLSALINKRNNLVSQLLKDDEVYGNDHSRYEALIKICHRDETALDLSDIKAELNEASFISLVNRINNRLDLISGLDHDNVLLVNKFIHLLRNSPRLIFLLEIDVLARVIKLILSNDVFAEESKNKAIYFFKHHYLDVLTYLKDISKTNGDKLHEYTLLNRLSEEQFFKLIQVESYLIYLASIYKSLSINDTEDDVILGVLYNFEELLLTGKVKVIMSCMLFKSLFSSSWKNKLNSYTRRLCAHKEDSEHNNFSLEYIQNIIKNYLSDKSKVMHTTITEEFEKHTLALCSSASSYSLFMKNISFKKYKNKKIFDIIIIFLHRAR